MLQIFNSHALALKQADQDPPSNLPPVILYEGQGMEHHFCLLIGLPGLQQVCDCAAFLFLTPAFAAFLPSFLYRLKSVPTRP